MTLLDTPRRVVLEVYGDPRAKGSKSAVVRGGRAHVIESKSARGRQLQAEWVAQVRGAAQQWAADHPGRPLDMPLALTLQFWLARPPSIPKRRIFPTVKPDVDKISRLVADCLTSVIYRDDALVCDLHVTKRYAVDRPAGCTIIVEAL